MVIEKSEIDGKAVYSVCADVRETGSRFPQEIVHFGDLDTAVLIMKFMRGDRMPDAAHAEARAIIKKYDDTMTKGHD